MPLKRHPQLIEHSHEHHHILALSLRISRDLQADYAADIGSFRTSLLDHFTEEEEQFAAYWLQLPDASLKARFDQEHAHIRQLLTQPDYHNAEWKSELARSLKEHIRFEERELFEQLAVYCLPSDES